MAFLQTVVLAGTNGVDGIRWIDGRQLPLEGRAFNDVEAYYDRLPSSLTSKVNHGVHVLKHHTSGMQFRFRTDSAKLRFRWTPYKADLAMDHMPSTGVSGIDVYAYDEAASKWTYVKTGRIRDAAKGGSLDLDWKPGTACLVNLPLYNGVKAFKLGLDLGTKVEKLGPRKSGVEKPVVFYGTSITQGGCCSRPGLAFVNRVGRDLDVPVVGLGFSDSGDMELEMSEHLARIDASCYVLDCLWNMGMKAKPYKGRCVDRDYEPFVRNLRARRPDVPIVMAEQCDVYGTGASEKDTFVRALYEKLIAEGWRNLVYLPKDDQLGDDREGTVDGAHPNDLGMATLAEAFGKAVQKALDLRASRFVANPKVDFAPIAAPTVMGRKYWTMLMSNIYSDPYYKLSEKDRATGTADLPVFRDCALYFEVGWKHPRDPHTATFPRVVDNFPDGENNPMWHALEANLKPDKPVNILFMAKRSYYAQVGEIDLDFVDYRAWLKRHPNLLSFNFLDEWVGDAMNIDRRVNTKPELWSTQEERDRVKRRLGSFPKTREGMLDLFKAYVRHQQALYWNDEEHFGGLESCYCVNHLAPAWGAKLIQYEVTDSFSNWRWDVCLPFVRGAARQFGVPWIWYYANTFRGWTKDNKEHYMSECLYASKRPPVADMRFFPEGGCSLSLERRATYYGYLNGATAHLPENWTWRLLTTNEVGGRILSPHGKQFSDYHDFTAAHPNRGEPFAPVAILTPFNLGYVPAGGKSMCGLCDVYRPGDYMVDGVFYTIVPGLDAGTLRKAGQQTCLRNSPYAQMYDVLVPDSPQPAVTFLERLRAYPVAILAGEYPAVGSFWPTLCDYVRGGGTLLVPRANVPASARGELLKLLGDPIRDESGKTLAHSYDLGDGRLIVSVSEWMTPAIGNADQTIRELWTGKCQFPEIAFFLRQFQKELFPFEVAGDCEYGASRTEHGWWLWVYNNKGVTKFIDTVETVDRTKDAVIRVSRNGRTPVRQVHELMSGRSVSVRDGQFGWTVPAGGIAVFEVEE